MSAMLGVGLLSGVTILGSFAKRASNVFLVCSGLTGMSLGMFLMAAAPYVSVAASACFLIGLSAGGVIVPAQTSVQHETGAHLLGRVTATVTSLTFAAQIAGLLLSGLLLQRMGPRGIFSLCASLIGLLAVAGTSRGRYSIQSGITKKSAPDNDDSRN